MCGIVGILGTTPVAPLIVDALKRLEYRGYDSAGIATLESGHLDAPARRGQAAQPRSAAARAAARRATSASATPAGRRMAGPTERNAHPHATDQRRRRAQRHHREFPRAARASCRRRLRASRRRPTPRSWPISSRARCAAGNDPVEAVARDAAAAARRLRARLPVRRRGGSADRRAPGRAARRRLWRGRDVSGLRRPRAGALHRRDHLSGGRRLGGPDAARAPSSATPPATRRRARSARSRSAGAAWSTRATTAISWPRKSTSSPRSSATRSPTTSTWRPGACALPFELPFDLATTLERLTISACGTAYYRRPRRQILVRALRPAAGRDRCRLGVPLPRGAARARRAGALHLAVGRDGRHAGGAALRQGAGPARSLVGRQRADLDHRARERRRGADLGRPGDRRRLDQGVHLPARGAGLPRDRGRAARAAPSSRRRERCARARADRRAGPDGARR